MKIIRFEHVKKSFGKSDKLKDINAEIEKGDVVYKDGSPDEVLANLGDFF